MLHAGGLIDWLGASLTVPHPFNVILTGICDRVTSLGVLEEHAENLDQQSPSAAIPAGSYNFIGARSPIYPRDMRAVLGDFMPHNPHMFFVAHGQFDTPWLYLEAFRLCVTLGPLLHHEKDFSFFGARTSVRDGNRLSSPLLTLIIPHYLGLPVWFPLGLQGLYQYTDRAELKDLVIPEVAIDPRGVQVWRRNVVEMGPPTEIQAAAAVRLARSWMKLDREEIEGDR